MLQLLSLYKPTYGRAICISFLLVSAGNIALPSIPLTPLLALSSRHQPFSAHHLLLEPKMCSSSSYPEKHFFLDSTFTSASCSISPPFHPSFFQELSILAALCYLPSSIRLSLILFHQNCSELITHDFYFARPHKLKFQICSYVGGLSLTFHTFGNSLFWKLSIPCIVLLRLFQVFDHSFIAFLSFFPPLIIP